MSYASELHIVKRIAFVANDDKKSDLIHWSYFNRKALALHQITTCGSAARILEGTLNTPITMVDENELAVMIRAGKVDAVIFFGDVMQSQNCMDKLFAAALEAGIVIAANPATADVYVAGLNQDQHQTHREAKVG